MRGNTNSELRFVFEHVYIEKKYNTMQVTSRYYNIFCNTNQ